MNSKSIFKRILPILIALVVILIIAIVGSALAKDKKVPSFSDKNYGKDAFITYTTSDGTEIKLSRNAVYDALRGTSSTESVVTDTTVNELVNMIDADLLAEYVSNVKEQDVYDLISKQIFQAKFDEYIKNNEDTDKVSAHKEGRSYRDYLNDKIDEAIEKFVDTLKYSYGIKSSIDEFEYKDSGNNYYYVQENGADKLDDDGNKIYQLRVSKTSEVYAYFALDAARADYAKKLVKEEFEEDFKAYLQYQKDLEAYNAYLEAVNDYEEALEDWKNTKNGAKPKKSDFYTKKVEEPEEVSEPLNGALDEDAFKDLYEDENFAKFWAIIVPFDTQSEAQDALLQQGIVIAENANGDNRWFHAGCINYADATDEEKAIIKGYNFDTKGDTRVIVDDDYYNLLTTDQELYDKDVAKTDTEKAGLVLATKDNPDHRTGAYELTEAEVKAAIIELYNQKYQYNPAKQLTNADYDPTSVDATYDEDSKLYYEESKLTSLGLYTTGTSSNKFYKFSSESSFDKAETYTNSIISASGKYYVYLIVAKDSSFVEWEDYLDGKEYYETDFYNAHKDELLENQVNGTYTSKAVSKLRYNSNIIIYDEVLEKNYMDNYTSDYKATKKSSKTVIASYEVNGSKKEITVDDLWAKVASNYGVYTTVDLLQYKWIFLEAQDADGNLFNKYVDYNKYLSGKKLSKCVYDTKEAKDLYENVSNYVDNVKYYFSVGYYESYGYPSSYGWKNFITDYYATYYNVKLETNDDLKLFFINQQIINEYSNYISKVNEENWATTYLTYAGKKLAEYINASGIHVLISIPDVEKNEKNNSTSYFVDPTNWTDEQLAAAEELYDKILGLLEIISEDEIDTELKALVSAFDDSSLALSDGGLPQIDYTEDTLNGHTRSLNYFKYTYNYFAEGATFPTYTIEIHKYKELGFKLTCEDLTITQGTMVSEFEDAVRQIWNSQLDRLVKETSITETVVYDHSFNAPEYKGYNEDTSTEYVVNDNGTKSYLTTTYGLHVYVNKSCDLSAYFTTNKDNDKVFTALPDLKYVQMYVYDYTETSDPDYISLGSLYDEYKAATEDNDEVRFASAKEKIEKAKAKLGFDALSFDDFYALLKNYADEDSYYISSQLSTYFTSYTSDSSSSSASFSMAFADYRSSTYYHLCYMRDIVAKANNSKVALTDGNDYLDKLKDYANYFVDSYSNAFQTIYFLSGSKESTKDLLNALACINGIDAYNDVCGDAINALKTYATNAYNNLSAEDKADLQEAANKAGIN